MTACVIGAIFAAIFLRIAFLSVVRGQEYDKAAERNLTVIERIDAPRGNIFDRNGNAVAINRKAYSLSYIRRSRSEEEVHEALRVLGELLGEDLLAEKKEIIEQSRSYHTLARRLSHDQIVAILERQPEFPGLRVQDDFVREYPYGPPMGPVVGFTGAITAEDKDKYQRPLYQLDDYVGRAGVEKQYELELVGKPGTRLTMINALRMELQEPVVEKQARAGEDLVLTIDAKLQQYARELLGDQTGSVVLMDVKNGELLVLATSPVFDPSRPWVQELNGSPVSFLNRAFRGSYPPGSTFKLVTASAAIRDSWTFEHEVRCTGNFQWPGWSRPFWCDVRSGHGRVDLTHALQYSCNVFFFESAYEMGPDVLLNEARLFGFGVDTGIDLPGERSGSLPSESSLDGGELLNFSIGQGAFLATPLQVAVSFAALANGGDLVTPHVVKELRAADASETRLNSPAAREHFPLGAQDRSGLIESFYRAVNVPGGTAFRVGFPKEWELCGKTGTAENGQGGVDAWFAGFFPRFNPQYVAVAHVENAEGHGGDIAGPIVRDMVARLLENATE